MTTRAARMPHPSSRRLQLTVAVALLAVFTWILVAADNSSDKVTLQGTGDGPVNPGPNRGGVTDGGVASTGHFTVAGAIDDSGTYTDRRSVDGRIATVRKILVGTKGTITMAITIHLGSSAASLWRIISATRGYAGLHGSGRLTEDNYQDNPYTFVMTGSVAG